MVDLRPVVSTDQPWRSDRALQHGHIAPTATQFEALRQRMLLFLWQRTEGGARTCDARV